MESFFNRFQRESSRGMFSSLAPGEPHTLTEPQRLVGGARPLRPQADAGWGARTLKLQVDARASHKKIICECEIKGSHKALRQGAM